MILGGNLLLWGRSTWISDAEIQVIRFSRLEANLIQVPLKCFHSKLFKLTIIWNDIPGSILQCGDDWWACDLQSMCEFSFAIMIINIIIKQSWDFVSVITIIEDNYIYYFISLFYFHWMVCSHYKCSWVKCSSKCNRLTMNITMGCFMMGYVVFDLYQHVANISNFDFVGTHFAPTCSYTIVTRKLINSTYIHS